MPILSFGASARWAALRTQFAARQGTLADGQGISISTLDGTFQRVDLTDSATPEQDVEIGGKLRSVLTRYPGKTKPSTQIMGLEEDDITIEGWFRDTWANLDGYAAAQYSALRSIWIARRYCVLSFGSLVVRRGYIKELRHTIRSERAIRYRLVFEVHEADEAAVLVKPFPPAVTPFDLLALIREIGEVLDDLGSAVTSIDNVAQAVT